MTKKIVLLFDGTWNAPDIEPEIDGNENTNVAKLSEWISETDKDGIAQQVWYEPGVGTEWYRKVSGGAFGVGLSDKIKEGYQYLAEHYENGDQIYIFGFSRGAYSARSLVGLIRNCGLLQAQHLNKLSEAYSLYRTRGDRADSENARFFRSNFSREINIHFLGVWDTVGALGVPLESFDWFNKQYYEFHDCELSGIVKNAFQALAIDEHRETFSPSLWDPKHKPNQRVEQVWFAGAHANIGGGYPNNRLSNLPLAWMIDRAKECCLNINFPKGSLDYPYHFEISDSYDQFLKGLYKKLKPRYYRNIGTKPFGNESIHASVVLRLEEEPTYNPKNTVEDKLVGDYCPIGRLIQRT